MAGARANFNSEVDVVHRGSHAGALLLNQVRRNRGFDVGEAIPGRREASERGGRYATEPL